MSNSAYRWLHIRIIARVAGLIASPLLLLVTSCAVVPTGPERTTDVLDQVRAIDLLPRNPRPTDGAESQPGDGIKPVTFYGTDAPPEPLNAPGDQLRNAAREEPDSV